MSWQTKRQLLVIGLLLLVLILVAGVTLVVRHPAPTCNDGKQNGDELGVDCGGACTLACLNQAEPLHLLWTRVLPLGDGRYSLVALIENLNQNFGLPQIKYQIRVFDADNLPVATQTGETFVDPGEKFALFAGLINSPERTPKVARLEFVESPNWQRVAKNVPLITVGSTNFTAEPLPQLTAHVTNQSLTDLTNINFVAVASDDQGNAVAGSATLVDSLPAGESRDIFFTWPRPLPTAALVFSVYPRVNIFDLAP